MILWCIHIHSIYIHMCNRSMARFWYSVPFICELFNDAVHLQELFIFGEDDRIIAWANTVCRPAQHGVLLISFSIAICCFYLLYRNCWFQFLKVRFELLVLILTNRRINIRHKSIFLYGLLLFVISCIISHKHINNYCLYISGKFIFNFQIFFLNLSRNTSFCKRIWYENVNNCINV